MQNGSSPLFAYRTTYFTQRDIYSRLESRDAVSVIQDPDINTVFRHSLPKLWERIEPQLVKPNKKLEHTLRSYLLRMASRPTPFGLFSGLGVGQVTKWESSLAHPGASAVHRRYALRPILKEVLPRSRQDSSWVLNPTLRVAEGVLTLVRIFEREARAAHSYVSLKVSQELTDILSRIEKMESKKRQGWERLLVQLGVSKAEAIQTVEGLMQAGVLVVQDEEHLFYSQQEMAPFQLVDSLTFSESARAPVAPELESQLFFEQTDLKIGKSEAERILNVARMTLRFANNQRAQQYADWNALQAYLNKWHDHGPVPVLDISPSQLEPFLAEPKSGRLRGVESFIRSRLREIDSSEWDLTAGDLETLEEAALPTRPVPVIGALVRTNEKRERFVLDMVSAHSATKTLGRFGAEPAVRKLIDEVQAPELQFRVQTHVAEIANRYENMTHRRLATRYSTVQECVDTYGVTGKGRIPIADLGFYRTDGGWVLVSLKTGREVDLLLNHKVNFQFDLNFYFRVLASYAAARSSDQFGWFWLDLMETENYLPRVKLQSVILCEQRWILRGDEKIDRQKVDEQIRRFQRSLPPSVFMTEADMRLPLETGSEHFYYELIRRLKKQAIVILEEDTSREAEANYEMIFFDRQPALRQPLELDMEAPVRPHIYWKIGLNAELYTEVLASLAQFNSRKKMDVFYILYPDPQFHIRLRFLFDSEGQRSKSEGSIVSWLVEMKAKCLIDSFERAPYQPERHRWPGRDGVKTYEALSALDSQWALQELSETQGRGKAATAVYSTADWLERLFPQQEERHQFVLRRIADLTPRLKQSRLNTKEAAIDDFVFDQDEFLKLKAARETPAVKSLRSLKPQSPDNFEKWGTGLIHLSINRRYPYSGSKIDFAIYRRLLREILK